VRQKIIVDAGTKLLRGSSHSVEAIAAELGYADARSFRRFIKSATGRTPEMLRGEPSFTVPCATLVRDRIRQAAIDMIA
jgi:transcriptional regulator GlxA family with amidase domain